MSISDDMAITLFTTEKAWKDAFQSFKIEHGSCNEAHQLRPHHEGFRRRSSTPVSSAVSSATSIIPTGSPTATTASLNLAFDEEASTFSASDDSTDIKFGCKSCKTTGTLDLVQTQFNIKNLSQIESDIEANIFEALNPFDYVESGSVTLAMNNFDAYIELEMSPFLSGRFVHTLFTVPIFGFSIPGIGKAGLLFEPQLEFIWSLNGGIDMTYGFDLSVPTNSSISVNLAAPNESTVVGFDKTTITAIPFQANVSDIEMTMQIALRPHIEIGFSFFDSVLLLEGGVFLDLPAANVTITQLATAQYDSNCESNGTDIADAKFDKVFQNVTHIVPDVGFAVGLDFNAIVDIPDVPNIKTGTSLALTTTTIAMATECLAYQTSAASGQAFATASVVAKKVNGASGRGVDGFTSVTAALFAVGAGFFIL